MIAPSPALTLSPSRRSSDLGQRFSQVPAADRGPYRTLPGAARKQPLQGLLGGGAGAIHRGCLVRVAPVLRSEEHTSELQSRPHRVSRLLFAIRRLTTLSVLL